MAEFCGSTCMSQQPPSLNPRLALAVDEKVFCAFEEKAYTCKISSEMLVFTQVNS